jgi:hypothetical protein
MKESAVASHIRLTAAHYDIDLWRNNVGACQDKTGRMIRYGLCNDSPALSKVLKSSDFIGITPVKITPDMVGQVIGVFTAIETKASDWQFKNSDKRAIAQKAFHDIVLRAGGFAGFARNVQEFLRIVRK